MPMQPRPRAETSRPDLPSLRCCMFYYGATISSAPLGLACKDRAPAPIERNPREVVRVDHGEGERSHQPPVRLGCGHWGERNERLGWTWSTGQELDAGAVAVDRGAVEATDARVKPEDSLAVARVVVPLGPLEAEIVVQRGGDACARCIGRPVEVAGEPDREAPAADELMEHAARRLQFRFRSSCGRGLARPCLQRALGGSLPRRKDARGGKDEGGDWQAVAISSHAR